MGRQLTEEAEKAKREVNKSEEERTAGECFHYTGCGNRPHNHAGVGHERREEQSRTERAAALVASAQQGKNPAGGRPQLPARRRHRTPLTPRSPFIYPHTDVTSPPPGLWNLMQTRCQPSLRYNCRLVSRQT